MNLLKALFGEDTSEVPYFENTLPLMGALFNEDDADFTNPSAVFAIAAEAILPGKLGHVKFQGSRWRAYCQSATQIPAAATVRVIGRYRSTILLVEPAAPSTLAQNGR